jgi:hypothetical protein
MLAMKLELYRYAIKVVMTEIEQTFPEGGAALEHVSSRLSMWNGCELKREIVSNCNDSFILMNLRSKFDAASRGSLRIVCTEYETLRSTSVS